jgi:hypothetical protein
LYTHQGILLGAFQFGKGKAKFAGAFCFGNYCFNRCFQAAGF